MGCRGNPLAVMTTSSIPLSTIRLGLSDIAPLEIQDVITLLYLQFQDLTAMGCFETSPKLESNPQRSKTASVTSSLLTIFSRVPVLFEKVAMDE